MCVVVGEVGWGLFNPVCIFHREKKGTLGISGKEFALLRSFHFEKAF